MESNRLVEQGNGEVDLSLLEGTGTGGLLSVGYFCDGPLIDHLREDEQIHYTLQNHSKGLTISRGGTDKHIEPGTSYRTALLATDSRLLFVVGQADGDKTFTVRFRTITDVETSSGVLKDRITVHSLQGSYDMYLQKEADLDAIRKFLLQAARNSQPHKPASQGLSGKEEPTDGEGGRNEGLDASELPESPESMQKPPNDVDILVATADGEPVLNATVKLKTDSRVLRGTTGSTGRAQVEVPAGVDHVELEIDHPFFRTVHEEVSVNNGGNIDVSLSLAEADDQTADETGGSANEEISNDSQSTESDSRPDKGALLEELTELNEQRSNRVTRGRMRAAGRYDPEQYEEVFGTWSAAIEAMESSSEEDESTSPANQKQYSKEEVVDAIAEVAQQVDGRPKITDMNELGRISPSPAYRYFASWDDAVSPALELNNDSASGGVEPDVGESDSDSADESSTNEKSSTVDEENPTDEALLEEICRLKGAWGRVPTKAEMANHGEYSPRQFEIAYGTWSDAVRAARFEPHGSKDSAYPCDEVISALRDVASIVERPPTVDDINEHAPMSATVIYNYFDSLNDAYEAADVNGTGTSSNVDIDDPLADRLEEAPEGRLSGVDVEVISVYEPEESKRSAGVDLRSAGGEAINLDLWSKHEVDWEFGEDDKVRLDQVRLNRWNSNGETTHRLSSTKDFSAIKIEDKEDFGPDEGDGNESEDVEDEYKIAINQIVGLGGATEKDAAVLVKAGYESREDLKAASLEDLRSLAKLDDGVALRIKAELG